MKKLFLILGILGMYAGMAFAQVATVESYGTGNSAAITQDGLAGQTATILQGYNGSGGDVEGNAAKIDQINNEDQDATITQLGNYDEAYVMQSGPGSTADVDQAGSMNNADVYQYNKNHIAETFQEGTGGVVHVHQRGGDTNEAYLLEQDGQNNYASFEQAGTSNEAEISQFGRDDQGWNPSNSIAEIYQGRESAPSIGNDAKIIQKNYENLKAFIYQYGDGDYAKISQWGEGSHAVVEQNGGRGNWAEVHQYNRQHFADIFQDGSGNIAYVFQGWTDVVIAGDNSDASIRQDGNENMLYLDQRGTNNDVNVLQVGDGNIFGINSGDEGIQQWGDENSIAGVTCVENDELLDDKLSFDAAGWATQNDGATLYRDSYQRGNNNKIGMVQNEGDWAIVQQYGIGNEALLWQEGGKNGTIKQFGDNNDASVIQF